MDEEAWGLRGFLTNSILGSLAQMRSYILTSRSLRNFILLLAEFLVVALAASLVAAAAEPNYAVRRIQMIRTIEAYVQETSFAIGRDHIDSYVFEVMGALPRHEFVPEDFREASRVYS
jgi:hypothetical protein